MKNEDPWQLKVMYPIIISSVFYHSIFFPTIILKTFYPLIWLCSKFYLIIWLCSKFYLIDWELCWDSEFSLSWLLVISARRQRLYLIWDCLDLPFCVKTSLLPWTPKKLECRRCWYSSGVSALLNKVELYQLIANCFQLVHFL